MKIKLTEQEMINIVASLSEQDLKMYCDGEYTKWIGNKVYHGSSGTDEFYEFNWKYDKKGNLKDASSTQDAPEENKV